MSACVILENLNKDVLLVCYKNRSSVSNRQSYITIYAVKVIIMSFVLINDNATVYYFSSTSLSVFYKV